MTRPARLPSNGFSPDWPKKRCSDASAETARRFVVNLAAAIDGRSLRTIGELVGVDYSALSRILSGDTWPDLATIAKLEHGLNASLYPRSDPLTERRLPVYEKTDRQNRDVRPKSVQVRQSPRLPAFG